jgi:hypothetical protein
MPIIKISSLRIGQKFRHTPPDWYEQDGSLSKLIYKSKRHKVWNSDCTEFTYEYDLKWDARVVNPPAVAYGVQGDYKVNLITGRKN